MTAERVALSTAMEIVGEAGRLAGERDEARRECERLRSENLRLRVTVERVEWFQQQYNGRAECPWCLGYRPSYNPADDEGDPNAGHRPGCRRQAALA